MEEDHKDNSRVRIFVGGLGESVTPEDLHRLLGSLGTVEGVETIRTKGRSFAYVDFVPSPTDEKSLPKLFSKYNGCLWKGGKLRLEKAKEHYLVRLKREWGEEAELVISKPSADLESGKGVTFEKMPDGESSKIKQLNIFFPKLRKVKSIPFKGTGKHKYSFQNIKVPPLPVHFCDCEEHCSPSSAERGKLSFDVATESSGMNDDEINIMNTVMNKLFEKEKVFDTKHLEREQVSFDSPNDLHSNEVEVDSATDEDDIIINVETKKNKTALTGSQELERILENQESWLNKTRIVEEEPRESMLEVHKRNNRNLNKKRKSLPNMENESNRCVSTTSGVKSSLHTLPDELGSGVQPTESKDGFVEATKVSWSQKSSWRELLGRGGNTAFSASLILPKFDSGEDLQSSDGPCTPNNKTEDIESDGYQGSKPTDTQEIKDLAEAQPADTRATKELAEAHPTDKSAARNKTGRGASWQKKQSWTQLLSENTNSFSISQILPEITFQEPMAKESAVDPANCNDYKHDGVAKQTTNDIVGDGFNLGKVIPEKSEHAGTSDVASAPVVDEKVEGKPKERSTEEIVPRERSFKDVDIGNGCSFMRSPASLREWEKAKAALSKSLKRKRSDK